MQELIDNTNWKHGFAFAYPGYGYIYIVSKSKEFAKFVSTWTGAVMVDIFYNLLP